MACYAIGDIQGCYRAFRKLLDNIQFDPDKDTLWLTGDLINRGTQSLEVLRFVQQLGNKAIAVLGNHELHYLAVASGAVSMKTQDTFGDILVAPDAQLLFDWVRFLPLAYYHALDDALLVHAGFAPHWNIASILSHAKEVETVLQSTHYLPFLKQMYHKQTPTCWADNLQDQQRLTVITNYFTRMRYIDKNQHMRLDYAGSIGSQPEGYFPWFTHCSAISPKTRIIFGHWSSLGGQSGRDNFFAMDTGCCWGNCLTALRLTDLRYFKVNCNE